MIIQSYFYDNHEKNWYFKKADYTEKNENTTDCKKVTSFPDKKGI